MVVVAVVMTLVIVVVMACMIFVIVAVIILMAGAHRAAGRLVWKSMIPEDPSVPAGIGLGGMNSARILVATLRNPS